MAGTIEDQMLVDLVGHDERVVPMCQVDDVLQGLSGKHCTGRVVRVIDDDQPGLVGDHRVELVQIGLKIRCPQRHGDVPAAGQTDDRGIGIVEGLKGDHLVARFHQRQDGGGNGLGCPGGDQDLGARIGLQTIEALLVLADRRT
ncbi:hypothetical protein SDC9_65641 [bioreactor metagenome]|uniref:Uncharacterized protein n=1 Tax=bioreactor metagenome TaxID=1076179 RepID=A0A644XY61_9ZZZZ